MYNTGKFKEADGKAQEGTSASPRRLFDSARGEASGSSHLQTESLGGVGKMAEMAKGVLTKVLDVCCPQSDQEKQINEITESIKTSIEMIPVYKKQYDSLCNQSTTTIDNPVKAMLKFDSVHQYLCYVSIFNNIGSIPSNRRRFLEKCDKCFNEINRYKEEYFGIERGKINIDESNTDDYLKNLEQLKQNICDAKVNLASSIYHLDSISKSHRVEIQKIWKYIKQQLENRYKIKLSEDDTPEELEKRIYQNLSAIFKHTEADSDSSDAQRILSSILNAGLKVTGKRNKHEANEEVIEKLFVMLKDKESFSREERNSIIKVIGYIGSEYPTLTESRVPAIREEMYGGDAANETFSDKNDVANRVAKKFFLVLDDKEKFSQELHQSIIEELGCIGSEKEGVAKIIAKQLFDICSNRKFTLEQRKSSIDAIHNIVLGLWKHKETRQCIIDIINVSKQNDLEPELQQKVEEFLNKWKS